MAYVGTEIACKTLGFMRIPCGAGRSSAWSTRIGSPTRVTGTTT